MTDAPGKSIWDGHVPHSIQVSIEGWGRGPRCVLEGWGRGPAVWSRGVGRGLAVGSKLVMFYKESGLQMTHKNMGGEG